MELYLDELRALQGDIIEDLGSPWPVCPLHVRHPLTPTAEAWVCPSDPAQAWDYGTVRLLLVPARPPMRDGEIMWMQKDEGWGVIARHEGDVWFHCSAMGRGFDDLDEGDRVGFTLKQPFPTQGRFLAADAVWLESEKS